MKKVLSFALVAVLALTVLVGCSGNGAKGEYKDGKYRVEAAEFSDKGWKEYAEITVKDGKVETVLFDGVNKDNLVKSTSEAYDKSMKDANCSTWPSKFYRDIEAQYKEVQKVADMKNITDATHSVDNFKFLVGKLEAQMKEGKTETLIVPAE